MRTPLKRLVFGCCFCNESMEDEDVATITVCIDDKEQFWFGHLACFSEAIDPFYREFREEFAERL